MNVWQSVKVKNADHPLAGEVGTVQTAEVGGSVGVKFDHDGQTVQVSTDDLQVL